MSLVIEDREIMLMYGGHRSRSDGVCAMEAVAWLAGEPHSDRPRCVSPLIASFMRAWNDGLPDNESRTRLLGPLLPLTINTRSTNEVEDRRAWMMLDWLVRTALPLSLDLKDSLKSHAETLRALPEVTADTLSTTTAVVRESREASAAARAAARAAAWAAAWDAARAAAWDAARAAARDAARDAAWAAAWDAARAAARDAARDAAWDVAWDAVNDVVEASQQSACDLIRRLCEVK